MAHGDDRNEQDNHTEHDSVDETWLSRDAAELPPILAVPPEADGWPEAPHLAQDTSSPQNDWDSSGDASAELAALPSQTESARGHAIVQDTELPPDALAASLVALADFGHPRHITQRRIGRAHRRRGASLLLAVFVTCFLLTCSLPAVALARLAYDVADAAHRVSHLQTLFADGSASFFNASKLKDAQADVDAIRRDLFEINGAANIAGAPLAAISPPIGDARLLVRIGFDLTTSADEALTVGQMLLQPVAGGALGSGSAGLTTADLAQARTQLADATTHVQDAIAANASLKVSALPAQFQPDQRYGKLLTLLPTAAAALDEMNRLLDVAPALLGVGQPAYYLVTAMDRSELRPGGGFTGNYGILTLTGGKQSAQQPLSLHDVYEVDGAYFHAVHGPSTTDCGTAVPQPPDQYWWWPVRVGAGDTTCQYGWGLRDSNLSADFPTNARSAIQIAETAGVVPNHAPLQGVIAFTPVLIEDVLTQLGPLSMPDYGVTVTAGNLEQMIHEFQLGSREPKGGVDRKQFTHDLSSRLLDRIKGLHGQALKDVLAIAQQALKDKDLQIYLADPRAELAVQQLGLASEMATGTGDGFFVVDTNDGGNKANAYVTEHQTDYVTLLPDGGALHQLQIAVTYDKKGPVYEGKTHFEDYSDIQRTYLPGDATILGYSGFNPANFFSTCGGSGTVITDCSPTHVIHGPVTASDVPGRSMVMGALLVTCGPAETPGEYSSQTSFPVCYNNPIPHTQTVYIEWYTPHAYTLDQAGHGTYTELVEKQPGSVDTLTVYVDTSHLHAGAPAFGDVSTTMDAVFQQLIAGKKPILNNVPLESNTTVTESVP